MRRRERRRIDNKEFLSLLVEFANKQEKHPDCKVDDVLGQLVDDLIYNIETSGKFNRYTYRSEMRSEARKNCFAAIVQQKFSMDRVNPFAYFTTVVMNSFFKVLSDEKKQSMIKDALYEEVKLQNPNSRFDDQNGVMEEVHKSKMQEHSDWLPLKVVVDGKERIYETEESWNKYIEKKKKRQAEKQEREASKKK